MKKRGFGQGMWNGSGGKPTKDESIDQTALREIQEEFKVVVKAMVKVAEINFTLLEEDMNVLMITFLATDWDGEPTETDEMRPAWFPIAEVPYEEMWASDKEWLPIILSGKKIKARYTYGQEGGEVRSKEIEEVQGF